MIRCFHINIRPSYFLCWKTINKRNLYFFIFLRQINFHLSVVFIWTSYFICTKRANSQWPSALNKINMYCQRKIPRKAYDFTILLPLRHFFCYRWLGATPHCYFMTLLWASSYIVARYPINLIILQNILIGNLQITHNQLNYNQFHILQNITLVTLLNES